jgi:hypothetical protein
MLWEWFWNENLTLFPYLKMPGGFFIPNEITVAALFIVGSAVMETGLADIISSKIGEVARKSNFSLLV